MSTFLCQWNKFETTIFKWLHNIIALANQVWGFPVLNTINLIQWVKKMTSKSAMESFYLETLSYSLKILQLSNQEFNEIHWILVMKDAP